jgi:hypothetical protein
MIIFILKEHLYAIRNVPRDMYATKSVIDRKTFALDVISVKFRSNCGRKSPKFPQS